MTPDIMFEEYGSTQNGMVLGASVQNGKQPCTAKSLETTKKAVHKSGAFTQIWDVGWLPVLQYPNPDQMNGPPNPRHQAQTKLAWILLTEFRVTQQQVDKHNPHLGYIRSQGQ